VSANVRTQGAHAVDTFLVLESASGRPVPPERHSALRATLERLLSAGALPLEGDDEEPALRAGDAASRAAHALTAEQWEIARDALTVDERAPPLGRGTFGEVRAGVWRGTAVAVKRLRQQNASAAALELFRRELAVVHLLAHPNVVQFLGAVTLDAPLCIVTELLRAGSLADALDARGPANPPPLGRAVAWALDCARGMRYLHERRPTAVIHRDLKPANLLLDDTGRLKIGDFGLSKATISLRTASAGGGGSGGSGDGGGAAAAALPVVSRQTCGSWLYTAPEVVRGEPYTARVDVFAFAMILFELLTGEIPYQGVSEQAATDALAAGRRPRVERLGGGGGGALPGALPALVERCWAAAPHARPAFADVADALHGVATTLPASAFVDLRGGGGGGRSSFVSGDHHTGGATDGDDESLLRLWGDAARRTLRGALRALTSASAAASKLATAGAHRAATSASASASPSSAAAAAAPAPAADPFAWPRKGPRLPTPMPGALLRARPPPPPVRLPPRAPPPAGAAFSAPPGAAAPRRWLPLRSPLAPSLLDAFNVAAAVPRFAPLDVR
jgi:serine/threonine protein kinase